MDHQPRIAVVTSYFPTREEPYRGHSAYQTLQRLRDRAELHVFCPLPIYPSWYRCRPRRFRYRRMALDHQPEHVPATYFSYVTLPIVSRPFTGEACFRRVFPSLSRYGPDLILAYWLYPDGYAAVRCGRRLGKPVIVCGLGSDLRRLADPATRALTRFTLRRAHYVLTVSAELVDWAIALGANPRRSSAVLNGVDSAVFYPVGQSAARDRLGVPFDAEIVLYVGSLIPLKGVLDLVHAVARLAASRENLRLVCVGEGPLFATIRRRSVRLGIEDRVVLPGVCSSPEVRDWMAASDLLCLPSRSEGCPNVVIEALACGRPVVATNVGGIPELVGRESGILVPPASVAALEDALCETLERDWSEAKIRASYRRGWEDVADETWSICSRLLTD